MFLDIVLCITVAVVVWFVAYPHERNCTEPPYPECFDCNKGDCKGCVVPKNSTEEEHS